VLREANFKFTFVGKLDTDKRFLFYWSPRLLPVIYRLLIVSQNAAKNCRYCFFTQSSVLPQIMHAKMPLMFAKILKNQCLKLFCRDIGLGWLD
jgi:hypothetical protein